jgi:hypothetical protein
MNKKYKMFLIKVLGFHGKAHVRAINVYTAWNEYN